jgi:TatA/E family protein of Tat protein translocase
MFGISVPEMILILAIAIIVIGPKKIPDLAKSLGRAMGEFKKATMEFKGTMDIEDDLKVGIKEAKDVLGDLNDYITDPIDIKPGSQKIAQISAPFNCKKERTRL